MRYAVKDLVHGTVAMVVFVPMVLMVMMVFMMMTVVVTSVALFFSMDADGDMGPLNTAFCRRFCTDMCMGETDGIQLL